MFSSLIVSSFDRFHLPVPFVTVDDHSTIIWLAGEQDVAVVDALRAALAAATSSPTDDHLRPVIVDLRGVTFMDTTTAQALIDATATQRGTSPSLTLRSPSKSVRRMLDLCGHGDLLDIA
jgi:anti-anti-sigma factor